MYSIVGFFTAFNIGLGFAMVYHFRNTIDEIGPLEFTLINLLTGQDSWWDKTYRVFGLCIAGQYIVLAVCFAVVLRCYLLPLVRSPRLINFDDVKDLIKPMKTISIVFILSFVFRALVFGFAGEFKKWFGFGDFEIFFMYFSISVISEVPNMFYLYIIHYKSFQDREPSLS